MKIKFDKQKGQEALAGLAQNTATFGKKVAEGVKTNVNAAVEKSKSDSLARRFKKYNPLFPEEYTHKSFHLPNIIVIVDDAVRRNIDVCEGAIGWRGKIKETEVLYLYDEFVHGSGIQFVPAATCDAVYYVDSFDRTRFIRSDCVFSLAHSERLAELEHIACCLGAKRCSIEINVSSENSKSAKKRISLGESYNGAASNESMEASSSAGNYAMINNRNVSEFQGNDVPQKPILKWFSHDDTILKLIEMRCQGNNAIKAKTLELSGASCATMSQSSAYALDCTLASMSSASGSATMEAQASQEHHSKLIYSIEF